MFNVCSEFLQGFFRVSSEYLQSMFRVFFISSPSASSVSVLGIFCSGGTTSTSDSIFVLLMQSVFKTIVIVLHRSSWYVIWSCYKASSLFRSLLLLFWAQPLRGRCCCYYCYCCCCRRLAPPSDVIVEPSGRIATCDIGGWSFFVFRTNSNDDENRNVRAFKTCSE